MEKLPAAISQIRAKIAAIAPITEEAWEAMHPLFEMRTLRANESLLAAGQTAEHVYFLHQGLIRSYLLTHEGVEFSKSIISGPNFFAPVASLITQTPSVLNVETLTDCEISQAKYDSLEKLNRQFPDLERFHRKQMEWLYVIYEKSEIELATQNATQRYLNLRNRIPEIDQLIPQYKIASHLGITNVQLSRIRRSLK